MTDTDRHAKVKAAFLEAVAAPLEKRDEVLDRLCGDDRAMRREVETLLEYSGDANQTISITREKPPRFQTGDEFASRYQIIALLGRGSIGEVYRAEDKTLGVQVALKLLRNPAPALVEQLLEEVRLSRQITHPGICRVYDVGEAEGEYFFTMEYVDGEDLESLLDRIGRLPADKVRDVGIQICEGMAAAHEHGVLHRDLKPSNVMLDAAGTVRITDFGVAISVTDSDTDLVSGTPAYMAPEQLSDSQAATVASDLYAVGLILYEAATGKSPAGNDGDGTVRMRKSGRIEKPSELVPFIDPQLEKIILDLLRPDPAERPQSATDVAAELRKIPSTADAVASPRRRGMRTAIMIALLGAVATAFFFLGDVHGPSSSERPAKEVLDEFMPPTNSRRGTGIAVMPIDNATSEADHDYTVESLQNDLISLLSRVEHLRVIGEESVDRLRDSGHGSAEIGSRLGADYLAYGNLRKNDGVLQLNVKLVDVNTGNAVWENRFAPEPDGLRSVESEICDRILEVVDGDDEATALHVDAISSNPMAEDLYRHGTLHVPPYSPEDFRSSVKWLEKALAEDPNMEQAYAALGTAYVIAAMRGWINATEGYEAARTNATKALQLDDTSSDANVVRALVQGEFDWDWREAEASYRRALALNPSSAWGYRSYARFLSSQARFAEAEEATKRAFELDPTSPFMMQGAARRFYEARNYERASALARVAIQLDPDYPASYGTLCLIHLEQARFSQAVSNCLEFVDKTDNSSNALALLAYAYARGGRREEAAQTVQRVRRRSELDGAERAALAIAEDDIDGAMEGLTVAVDEHARPSIWLAVSPLFDPFRALPQFQTLIERVGLPKLDSAPARRNSGAA